MRESLVEYLSDPRTLYTAWRSVWKKAGAPGCDGVRTQDYFRNEANNIRNLSAELLSGRYQPSPLRETFIPKSTPGKWRRLSIPTVKDRIVQQAANQMLQSLCDDAFAPCSFAYRPGRGIREAVALLRRGIASGLFWAVRGDIRGCFDEIDRDILSALLRRIIPDQEFLALINKVIRAPVVSRGFVRNSSKGIPQGSPISPFLSNLYLDQFDTAMLSAGVFLVRFADDWVALAPDIQSAEETLRCAMNTFTRLRIELNRDKSGVLDLSTRPINFLGHTIDASAVDADENGWRRAAEAGARYRSANDREEFTRARSELMGIESMYRNSGRIRESF